MHRRGPLGAFALVITVGAYAFCAIAPALAENSKYPDLKGAWERTFLPRWILGQEKPPLTPEYMKLFEANLGDMADGGPGNVPSWACLPHGMPMMMNACNPMEIIVTPDITYLLISSVNDAYRRIYTDGRDWPAEVETTFAGYSIGKWIDEDGDGNYDVLEVETRHMRMPHTYDSNGIPFHRDNQAVITERIYVDKTDKNLLHNDNTSHDHALTHPWTKSWTYKRNPNPRPSWLSEACSEDNLMVRIGKDAYFLSADGKLMPTRKDQPPPDLSYFNQSKK